jgi:hypothetical protein
MVLDAQQQQQQPDQQTQQEQPQDLLQLPCLSPAHDPTAGPQPVWQEAPAVPPVSNHVIAQRLQLMSLVLELVGSKAVQGAEVRVGVYTCT